MSQICPKSDSSIFSDMSSPKQFIPYPHSSYQHSQFSTSNTSISTQQLKSEDECSSNDNSFEEMDAVKRFCNLSKPVESNGTDENCVNKDNIVDTFSTVNNVDKCNENNIAHNEDKYEENNEKSSENNLDESNSSTGLPDNIFSDSNIEGKSSDLNRDNDNAVSISICDRTQSATSEQEILVTPSDVASEINSTEDEINITEGEITVQRDPCISIPANRNCNSSPEKPASESPNRPVRNRPPSLKLIEAAGGVSSDEDYCGQMMGKVSVKKEPCTDPNSMPSLVSATDSPPKHTVKAKIIEETVPLSTSGLPVLPAPNVYLSHPGGAPPQPRMTTTEFQATPTIKDGNTSPWPVLGEGWIKKEVMRRNGLSAGRYDIYYISPEGVKVRSKPELQTLVGEALDLSNFNFRLGEFLTTQNGRPNSKRKKKTGRMLEIPDLVVAEEKESPTLVSMITKPDISRTPPSTVTSSPHIGVPAHLVTSSQHLLTSPPGEDYKEKIVRCKKCENCWRENCGKCLHCKDMKQFGGSNSRRQSCLLRKCLQGIKVKIAVKGKRPRESPPTSSNKKARMFGLQLTEPGTQTPPRQPESLTRPGHIPPRPSNIPAAALQKYITLSSVPQEFNLPINHVLSVKIGSKTHNCPLLWIDELFHQQTLLHYDKNVRSTTVVPPPPPAWPPILINFYNFTFQFTVTLNDVEYQFNVVEKCKGQTRKVCQYVRVYGSHVRDISVDIHFYQFLESVELYQYLPNHPKHVKRVTQNNNNQEKSMEDEMKKICNELTNLINNNPRIEEGLRKLLLKYLATSDLCTFILAVVNSNTVPAEFEAAVVEILKRDLNLQDISNLTDLTGLSLSNQPEVAAVETVVGNSSQVEKPDINKTLSSLVPDDSPMNEDVRNFILNEPLRVIEMINELQNHPGKSLTFETLSKMILEVTKSKSAEVVHIKTERIEGPSVPHPASVPRPLTRPPVPRQSVVMSGRAHNVTIPRVTVPYPHTTSPAQYVQHVKHPSTPPGYNPRYYTPHLSPQHQQRYGRPPLRRAAPNLQAIKHIAAPVIPGPKPGPRMREIRKIAPPPPPLMINKGVQVKPAQRTVQQQVSLKPVPRSRARREKFVDLDFCPHV